MVLALSLLVAIIGLLMFAFCTNSKLAQVGFALFEIGTFVFLFCYCQGGKMVGLLPSR